MFPYAMTVDDTLIFEPFNAVFWGLFLLFAAGSAGLTLLSRKKPALARNILGIYCAAVIVYYIFYKVGNLMDEEYHLLRIQGGMPEVSIWTGLSLQLCDVSLLTLPFAVLSRKNMNFLRFFLIFFGIPGAVLGTLVPFPGMIGYSILLPRVFGHFVSHFSIFFSAVCLLTLKIYRPSLKDFRRATAFLFAAYFFAFGVNLLFRALGLSEKANYFFSYAPMGIAQFEFFYQFIPVPGLYLAVPTLILLTIVYGVCVAVKKLSKNRKASH